MAGSQRSVCSLVRDVEVVRGDVGAWRALARYHYRGGHCGAADRVFAIRRKATERAEAMWPRWHDCDAPIGVIVYGMPAAESAMRNAATNGRYVGVGDNAAKLGLLNRELRTITRVVIDPRFRGIGLGRRLVAETLELAGTPLVEALAAMGVVNLFFERAGMTRYEGRLSEASERMLAAFEAVGLMEEMVGSNRFEVFGLRFEKTAWVTRYPPYENKSKIRISKSETIRQKSEYQNEENACAKAHPTNLAGTSDTTGENQPQPGNTGLGLPPPLLEKVESRDLKVEKEEMETWPRFALAMPPIGEMEGRIEGLDVKTRRWIVHEMDVFCQSHGQAGRKVARRAMESGEIAEMVRLVRRQVMLRPVYYLWKR